MQQSLMLGNGAQLRGATSTQHVVGEGQIGPSDLLQQCGPSDLASKFRTVRFVYN